MLARFKQVEPDELFERTPNGIYISDSRYETDLHSWREGLGPEPEVPEVRVKVTMRDGGTSIFHAPAGSILPIFADAVWKEGTTADVIMALWE